MTKKSGTLFLVIAILGVLAVFYFRKPEPCQEPVTYRIGKVDERFNLTPQEFQTAVHWAVMVWGKALSRNLFREDRQGVIEVNLIYDYRQEAMDKLRKLNTKMGRSKSSYDDLRASLETSRLELEQKKASWARDADSYRVRMNTYNGEVESWNRRGGVPENVHSRIIREKNALSVLRESLQIREEEIKTLVYSINNLVVGINAIASAFNLDLVDQDNVGKPLGQEFCEGLYEVANNKQTITIYQYDNYERLVRVLAHEFGHALGLGHTNNEEALMYRLIKSNALNLTADDIAAIQRICNKGS